MNCLAHLHFGNGENFLLLVYKCLIIIKCGLYCLYQYNAEIFPGLMYRMKQPKIVLLVFQSGKIVLTGAKVRGIYSAVNLIMLFPFLCVLLKLMVPLIFNPSVERWDLHCLSEHLSSPCRVQDTKVSPVIYKYLGMKCIAFCSSMFFSPLWYFEY